MGGGNLSLQVHPTTGYAQDRFGMAYTQDESYSILDASPDSHVCLGLHEGVMREGFEGALRRARAGDGAFDAERWSNRISVSRHDLVSIPAGTVHCSGSDTLGIEAGVPIYERCARDRSRFDFVARPPARLRRLVRLGGGAGSGLRSDWERSQVGPIQPNLAAQAVPSRPRAYTCPVPTWASRAQRQGSKPVSARMTRPATICPAIGGMNDAVPRLGSPPCDEPATACGRTGSSGE